MCDRCQVLPSHVFHASSARNGGVFAPVKRRALRKCTDTRIAELKKHVTSLERVSGREQTHRGRRDEEVGLIRLGIGHGGSRVGEHSGPCTGGDAVGPRDVIDCGLLSLYYSSAWWISSLSSPRHFGGDVYM
ncbi:hypothetical protein K432DRAFT_450034 [Lepidopterella palustris CBS 459.81]|uniref:Uncharacterized protein n=1 Tax=Lepidopterella palustris CBS 459.81 TaxID=1314670 RepID=A0A8E2ECP5_9PEZI|nr:hypothetical protein K432DRAFT_450034 [Lepidopterella palustris CBS 459.81]